MSTTIMDTQMTTLHEKTSIDYSSNVDTSRPFRSVKEAVEIFGERLLTGELFNSHSNPNKSYNSTPIHHIPPKQEIITSWKFSPSPKEPSSTTTLVDTLKKLEAELEETKVELKLLKERESETEVVLASLNAELHKNMSKMAEAEAAAARKVGLGGGSGGGGGGGGKREGERRRDLMGRMEQSPCLAEILSIGEKQGSRGYVFNGGGKKEMRKNMVKKKKKTIIPLVVELFSRKKGSSTALRNPFFSSF